MNSENPYFRLTIPKRIEPDSLTLFDIVQNGVDLEGYGRRMAVVGMRDSEFFFDLLNP